MRTYETAGKNIRSVFPSPVILFTATLIAAGALIMGFVFGGCDSPVTEGGANGSASSGPGEIVIGLGGFAGERTAVPSSTELAGMKFYVTLTGFGKTIKETFGPDGGRIKLDSGSWQIQVTARNSDNRIRGLADEMISITPGSHTIVILKSAVGIKTGAEFFGVLDPSSGSPLRSFVDGNTLLVLENDIDFPSLFSGTSGSGKYTLIAEPGTTRTVRRNGFGLSVNGYTLELGKSGETGNLVFDGQGVDGGPGAPFLYAYGGGTLVIDGKTEITRGSWSNNRGGAVLVTSGGRLEMRSGKITNCVADHGGAVGVDGGVFVMSGGELRGNRATNTTTSGGGAVAVGGDGTFTMSGGTISGNTTAYMGGAVYVDMNVTFPNTAFIQTGGTISGNTYTTPTSGFADVYPYWPDSWDALRTALSTMGISGNAGPLTLKTGGSWTANSSSIAISANITLVSDQNITVLRDLSFTGSAFFTVSGTGASLTLGKPGMTGAITLDGNLTGGATTTTSPLVAVSGGTLKMYDGVTLKNNLGAGTAGGVELNAGTFEMRGGTISENKGSTGGVVLLSGSVFTMYDNAVIKDNRENSTPGNGGGVFLSGTSPTDNNFIMYGGTIGPNNQAENGGGVKVQGGIFELRNGSITGNTASPASGSMTGGGGLYLGPGSIGRMTGGSITGNTVVISGSSQGGGGVFIGNVGSGGGFILNLPAGSGAIRDNTLTGGGSGTQVFDNNGISFYYINGMNDGPVGPYSYNTPQP